MTKIAKVTDVTRVDDKSLVELANNTDTIYKIQESGWTNEVKDEAIQVLHNAQRVLGMLMETSNYVFISPIKEGEEAIIIVVDRKYSSEIYKAIDLIMDDNDKLAQVEFVQI